jgi:mRNA-degrading endonuclease RelE of RelBE toxin-antitoxin system
MLDIQFTPRGEKELKTFPKDIQFRIQKKLRYYIKLKNPLSVAKAVVNLPPATNRFRIGKYRVSFYLESKTIFVERVELRGQAYRRY